jgi:hypothetical protein
MYSYLLIVVLFIASLALVLGVWHWSDYRADTAVFRRLLRRNSVQPALFDFNMVRDLPAPARRYFGFAIRPGASLYSVAVVTMAGKFGIGDNKAPGYLDMTARQVLALPEGFVWQMHARKRLLRLSGSDSDRWTRFWLMGLAPVARYGGDRDHQRSAFGRYVAEAVFWTPAALLPGPGIQWQAVDDATARVVVKHGDLEQAVDLRVDADGRPGQVSFQRWSNANPEKEYRWQPFGGYLAEFRDFEGFCLPTRIEAGNFFGTDDYFPFFMVDVLDVQFPHS